MVDLAVRDFEAFFQAPFNAYPSDGPYVSPLKSDLRRYLSARKNPLFASDADFTYAAAMKDGQPLGRITAHVHRASNARHGTNRASFGFFDCADDAELAQALLGHAEAWARAQGADELMGNFNLTAMQQMGVQTEYFGRAAYTDMIVNPPHIPRLLAENGFEPVFPVTTFEVALDKAPVLQAALPEGHRFAPITRRHFARRMEEARLVLNDGFAENPFFVPLTREEFQFQAGEMTTILDPRLSSVVLQGERPVAVAICIPDLTAFLRATRSRIGVMTPVHLLRHRFTRRRAVIIFISVNRDAHGQGLMSATLARTLGALRGAGYTHLGITWVADGNGASLRMMEKAGAQPLHRLHLFRKVLT